MCWLWAGGVIAACGVRVVPARASGCPDEGFREKEVHGLALPDCRDYEQASPVEANVDAQGFPGSVQSSLLGGRVRYWSVTPFPIPGACALDGSHPTYISSRGGEGGWATEGAIPCGAAEGGKLGFSEDLSETVVWATGVALTPGAPLSGRSYYLRYTEPPTGTERYRLLATANVTGNSEEEYVLYLAGFSGNDQHLLFETKSKLLAGASEGAPNTYEVNLDKPEAEQLSLVGVLPAGEGGKAPTGGSVAGAGVHPWASFTGHPPNIGYTQSAVSQDGSRVFFTALPSERVYLRENPGTPPSPTGARGECTVPADACTVAVSPGTAHFRGATPDGSHAFYSEGEDLYRYDSETGATQPLATPITAAATGDLTSGSTEITGVNVTAGEFHVGEDISGTGLKQGTFVVAVGAHTLTISLPAEETLVNDPLTGSPGGVLGVLGASGDGRTVYFAARGVLATNSNSQGETAANEPKLADLYESYQPTTGPPHTTFIARLVNTDAEGDGDEEDWHDYLDKNYPVQKSSRVTPDGQTLLFASRRSLTGYNNAGACGGFTHACSELYRYQAGPEGTVGRVTCVSCNPKRATLPAGDIQLAGEGAGTHESFERTLTRNLSENGDRVFFQTPDALVEGDTNGQTDVYEWETDGEGTCRSEAQNGGCLYLISSGTSNEQSYLGDASANGDNIFFFTRQALTPTEAGNNINVYDARTCNKGDPTCETPTPVTLAECIEECAAPDNPAPLAPTPSSTQLTGNGNLPAPRTTPTPPPAAHKPTTKLAAALKACRTKHNKHKRTACETQAHKRYGKR